MIYPNRTPGDRSSALRDALRRGDPADGRALTLEETVAMRRRIVAAAREAGPRQPSRLAFSWALAALALALLGSTAWQLLTLAAETESRALRVDASPPPRGEPTPAAPPLGAVATEPILPPGLSPTATQQEAQSPEAPSRPLRLAAASPRQDRREPPTESRTVHFATQRGTRIVWILNPELDL